MSTKIEWCDETINPIQDTRKGMSGRGYHCTKCSPGCENCYAERINVIRGNGRPFDGSTVEFELIRSELDKLSHWRKHRSVFVQSMGDLFHPAVPDELIATVIAESRFGKHTLLFLTKRPERMCDFLLRCKPWEGWITHNGHPPDGYGGDGIIVGFEQEPLTTEHRFQGKERLSLWPSPHVYFGITICNQREVEENGAYFSKIPGKTFLNLEPLLSAVDILPIIGNFVFNRPHAVILGGETGPGARPIHPDWVRSVRDQCAAANIPFFFKQWGEWRPESQFGQHIPSLRLLAQKTKHFISEDKSLSYKMSRNEAGRLLDGRTHDDLPWMMKEKKGEGTP